MSFAPGDEIVVKLAAGEWDEIVRQLQRSVTVTQQIITKIATQAQAQQQTSSDTTVRRPRAAVLDGREPAA